jgi:hypothetical protein
VTSVCRAFVAIGAGLDLLIALFLVIVFGFVLDSWHDPREPLAGPIVTTLWSIAFVSSAGAPILGYWLKRRKAAAGTIAWVVWLPAIVLIAICVVGLIISPL